MPIRTLLLLTVLIWGATFVATKVLLEYVEPAQLLGLRMLIGVPILFGLIVAKRIKLDFSRRQLLNLLIGSAVITAHFLIQITGLKSTTATNTGWLISITPLILVIISYIFLGERVSRWVVLGVVVATVGVILLISKGRLGEFRWLESVGDWLVLTSACTWAIYTAIIRDISRQKDPLAVTFAVLLPTFALMFIYLLLHGNWSQYAHLPARAIGAVLFLSILGTALAHWFWQAGVSKIGAAKAGIFLYLEPLASTVLGVTYLREQFGLFTAIGGLMVLGGVVVAERTK